MKSASGTETDTETATPYPPPIAGPFSDSKERVVAWDAITFAVDDERTTPITTYKGLDKDGNLGPGETTEVKTSSKWTYTIGPGKMTLTESRQESHAFPPPPIKPCGCKDAGGGSALDLTGVASAILSMLGPIFGGNKGHVYSVPPEGVPGDPTAPPVDPTAPAGQ